LSGLLLAVLVVTVAGCSPPAARTAPTFAPPSTQVPTPVAGEIYTVTLGTIVETIELRGQVEAKREERFASRIGGRLEAIHVSPGDRVEEGELLAELYAVDLQRQVAEAEYKLKDAETALAMEELQLQLMEFRVSQARRSFDQDEMEADIRRAMQELQVEQADRYVQRAQEALDAASEKVAEARLEAPFSGVIVSVDKALGEQVAAYEAVGVLADPSELRVLAMALADEVTGMAAGDPAQVQIDLYPDQTYAGSVVEIATEPIIWQGSAAYEVTVGFDEGQDLPAAVGRGASITIQGESREGVLQVPNRAIITIGDLTYVEIVREDGEIERVQIETGLSSGDETEVTAGLEEGDQVRLP
jgi:RND family efflux transporter MFP subunit